MAARKIARKPDLRDEEDVTVATSKNEREMAKSGGQQRVVGDVASRILLRGFHALEFEEAPCDRIAADAG